MARASRFSSGFDRLPDIFAEPEEYVKALSAIVRRRGIDVLLPVHEDALVIREHEDLLPRELIIACPTKNELTSALDKYEILRIASDAGVDCPHTLAPHNVDEALDLLGSSRFPLVLKTRRGNSGKGVCVVRSAKEGVGKYVEMVSKYRLSDECLPIIQEYLEGPVCGGCFLSQEGRTIACFTERYLRCKEGGFGTSVLREPFEHPKLRDYTARLAEALGWTGIGHFDFIWDRGSDRMRLIEMNPRFWGALNMAIQNGYDFPSALVTMLARNRPDMEAFNPSSMPVRSLWIVGEMIAGMAELLHGKPTAPLSSLRRILRPGGRCSYDDFRLSDPLPLCVEVLYYATQFILSGGKVNPERAEMMR
jgi:carbamoylphosphate synthase large subunit